MGSRLQAGLQHLVEPQRWLCSQFDRLFAAELRVDGNSTFRRSLVWWHVRPGMLVYDVGGGKRPFFSPEQKSNLKLRVCGVDISQAELDAAPAGSYDTALCADITSFKGSSDADLVICRAVLEHVPDTDRALGAIASILRPGGKALLFVPCRNAFFARLNLLLPHQFKRNVLFALLPETQAAHGFRSYYHRCTPADFRAMSAGLGLAVEELKTYSMSAYFSLFFPMYLLWRSWTLMARRLGWEQACETFSVVLRKPVALS